MQGEPESTHFSCKDSGVSIYLEMGLGTAAAQSDMDLVSLTVLWQQMGLNWIGNGGWKIMDEMVTNSACCYSILL